jgi:hypothetical protein
MKWLFLFFVLFSVSFAEKNRMNDVELMLTVINNGSTRALLRDSTLFVYVVNGKSKIDDYRECADIAGANRLVFVKDGVILEEKIKK